MTIAMIKPLCAAFVVLLLSTGSTVNADNDYAAKRQRMVDAIKADAALTKQWTNRGGFDRLVIDTLRRVPRHLFLPEALRSVAYENRPLPIGMGQTISQPFIVALMTDVLELQKGAVVLEVGTGSGYQAAVLADLGAEVFTIEIIEPLANAAANRLRRLNYDSVTVRTGDGYYGWPEHAPFDVIIVTAAATHVPPPLVRQLKPGGRLIIPVGQRFQIQFLLLVEKNPLGNTTVRQILPVAFVPLTGGHE